MLAEKIIGVWELQIWETVVDDKVIGYPLGEKASGFIAYHPIGFMSVNISARNRVRLATGDPFAGDPKLLALDAKGYLSYCGPFSIVSENEVIHHLKLCSFENWVGTDQHRHAQLDLTNDTLTLSTAPMLTQGRNGRQSPDLETHRFKANINRWLPIYHKPLTIHELNRCLPRRRSPKAGSGRRLLANAFGVSPAFLL